MVSRHRLSESKVGWEKGSRRLCLAPLHTEQHKALPRVGWGLWEAGHCRVDLRREMSNAICTQTSRMIDFAVIEFLGMQWSFSTYSTENLHPAICPCLPNPSEKEPFFQRPESPHAGSRVHTAEWAGQHNQCTRATSILLPCSQLPDIKECVLEVPPGPVTEYNSYKTEQTNWNHLLCLRTACVGHFGIRFAHTGGRMVGSEGCTGKSQLCRNPAWKKWLFGATLRDEQQPQRGFIAVVVYRCLHQGW